MPKLHPIETVNVPSFQGETLNLLVGCNGHSCKGHCWAFGICKRIGAVTGCQQCADFTPHTHFERARKIPKPGQPHCYFQDMAEPNDFPKKDIERLIEEIRMSKIWRGANPSHLFQILTHFPMEFYAKHPLWPSNTWAMGTFTQGLIEFPEHLRAGVVAAYCEPVQGALTINNEGHKLDWLVIGLGTKKARARTAPEERSITLYAERLKNDAVRLGIPVFMKFHPFWEKYGIKKIQQWPKVSE